MMPRNKDRFALIPETVWLDRWYAMVGDETQ